MGNLDIFGEGKYKVLWEYMGVVFKLGGCGRGELGSFYGGRKIFFRNGKCFFVKYLG